MIHASVRCSCAARWRSASRSAVDRFVVIRSDNFMRHTVALCSTVRIVGMENLGDGLRYDAARVRQSLRRGRERGVWVFVPAAEMKAAGIDPHGPAPKYRTWGRRGGSVLVRLYRD